MKLVNRLTDGKTPISGGAPANVRDRRIEMIGKLPPHIVTLLSMGKGKVMSLNYDLTNVIQSFLNNDNPSERAELVRFFGQEIRASRAGKIFTGQIGIHCAEAQMSPVQLLQIGIMYGAVLGVLLEKDRQAREKKRIV